MAEGAGGDYWGALNRRLSRRRLLAAGAAGAATALAACSGSSTKKAATSATAKTGAAATPSGTAAAGTPKPGGTWNQASLVLAAHFSPYHPTAEPSFTNMWRREFGYYERLWTFASTPQERKDATYHRIDRLAASTEQVDPMTVVVKLKPSNFHNRPPAKGRAVTAADIAADIDFLKHPPATGGAFLQSGKDLKSVTALDDQTLRFDMFGPRAFFFEDVNVALVVVPREMLDEQTLKTTPPLGNGPFVYKSYQQGSREEATRNPAYYVKGRPYIDGKVLTYLPDTASLEAAFRTAKIDDITFTDIKQAQSVAQDLGARIVTRADPSPTGMALLANIHRSPWKDPRVREAIYRGVDVQRVIDTIFFGDGERSWVFAPGNFTRFPLPWDSVQQYVGPDPKKAADLLKAAGVDPNHTYEWVWPTEAQTWIDSGNLYSEDLAKVGLKTRVNPVVRNIELQRLGPKPGDFDLGNSILLDYQGMQTHSGSFWDCASLEDPQVDALIAQITQTVDNTQRRDLSHQFEIMLAQKYSNLMPMLSNNIHAGWYSYMKGVNFDIAWQGYQIDRWIDK